MSSSSFPNYAKSRQADRPIRNIAVVVDSRQVLEHVDIAAVTGSTARSSDVFEYRDLPIQPAHFDFADLARRSADLVTAEIAQMTKGLFSSLVPAADLSLAYRAWLTYKLLQRDIPKLSLLASAPDITYRRQLLLQTAAPPNIARELAERHGRPQPSQPLQTFSGIEPAKLNDILAKSESWAAKEGVVQEKKKVSGGVAFLVGTPGEAAWIADIVERLPKTLAVNIVLKKKDLDLSEPFKGRWPNRRVSVGSWQGLANGCLVPSEHARVTAALRTLQNRLTESQAERLRDHGQWLASFFGTAVGAIGLARWLRPTLIVGSMEKSPIGLVLSVLGPHLGIKTFNIQHGNIGRQRVLDLVPFDMFGIWREETRQILLGDGYSADAKVRVVGRPTPPWTAELNEYPLTDAELIGWIGGRRVLTYFLQPPKPPYVSAARLSELLDLLKKFVGTGERDVLLVKPHPANTPDDVELIRRAVDNNSAIRLLGGRHRAMGTALAVTDIALSLYSTALQDALAAGSRAIAYDPDAVLEMQGMDLPDTVEVARSEQDLGVLLELPYRRKPGRRAGPDFLDRTTEIIRGLHGAWPDLPTAASAS